MTHTPYALERHLKPEKEVRSKFPDEALAIYDKAFKQRIPVGLAVHPDGTLAVLMAGQGPMIAWIQEPTRS